MPIEAARANPVAIDWDNFVACEPNKLGVNVMDDIQLELLIDYIDWTFFFHAWQLKGRYPQILEDREKGEEAKKLLADAREMLHKIITERWLTAKAVIGLFPANARG